MGVTQPIFDTLWALKYALFLAMGSLMTHQHPSSSPPCQLSAISLSKQGGRATRCWAGGVLILLSERLGERSGERRTERHMTIHHQKLNPRTQFALEGGHIPPIPILSCSLFKAQAKCHFLYEAFPGSPQKRLSARWS